MVTGERLVARRLHRLYVSVITLATIILAVTVFLILAAPFQASASQTVPRKINYQGRLTNSAGVAMPDGLYNMTFRLFTTTTGGTASWTEVRDTTNRVTLKSGQFAVQLGDVTALPANIFAAPSLYLEVELPTPASVTCSTAGCGVYTEGPMTPRQALASSAYAINSDTIDGIDGSSLVRNDTSNTFTGSSQIFKTANFAIQDNNGLTMESIGATGATLFQNTTDSTAAFSIQRAASAELLMRADTQNNRLTLGDAIGVNLNTTLLVLDSATADPTTNLVNGSMYYNTTNNKFRCRQGGVFVDCISSGGGSTTQNITLSPEYAGSVLSPDGSNNSVNVLSDSVSGLAIDEGYKHNFYQWDTIAATAQDYNIVINYQLPSGFTSFVGGSFSLWTYADSLTSTSVTFMLKSQTGASCYLTPAPVTPTLAGKWQQKAPGDPGNGCVFTAGDIVTFIITPTVIQPNTNKVKIGELRFAYQ